MMLTIRNSSKLIVVTFVLISAFSCQSKKKAMQASNAAEKARIEREAAEKKADAAAAELAARKAEEDKAKREAEQRLKESESKASTPAIKLGQYFSAISSSTNAASANTSINEALTLFASPETLVLIVISDSGGMKDYDKPTTIKDYLNYLKDQKKNINSVSSLKTDNAGKITELELKKN